MNSGIEEDAGRAANSIVDSLKSQPLSLALVVMNVLLLGYLFYNESKYIEARKEFAGQLFTQQEHATTLLARCILPEDFIKILQAQGIIVQPQQPPRP